MKNRKDFSRLILSWYQENKRDLPWRKTKNPYKIWVSEIILQQTQISQGTSYYLNFINRFPDLNSLAKASESDVLKVWEGLGYYSRAINMLNNAKLLVEQNKPLFPYNFDDLIKLKGIGEYTAAAISSICNNEKRAVLDGNVFRVISRVFNISHPINNTSGKKVFQKKTHTLLPQQKIGDYNQALMDFGAIHCTIKNPKCNSCPIKKMCQSFKLNNIKLRPVKLKSQKGKQVRVLNYFIIVFKKNLYIQKRFKKDIWKNLYEFPLLECENNLKPSKKSISMLFKEITILNYILSKKEIHQLSHQTLYIYFWKITCLKLQEKKSTILLKVPLNQLSAYPFPKPIRKYLTQNLIT